MQPVEKERNKTCFALWNTLRRLKIGTSPKHIYNSIKIGIFLVSCYRDEGGDSQQKIENKTFLLAIKTWRFFSLGILLKVYDRKMCLYGIHISSSLIFMAYQNNAVIR